MGEKPGWVVAGLLTLLAALMAAHLALFTADVWVCDKLVDVWIEHQKGIITQGGTPDISVQNEDCADIEREFGDAVSGYLSIILALLTGAGVAKMAARKDP